MVNHNGKTDIASKLHHISSTLSKRILWTSLISIMLFLVIQWLNLTIKCEPEIESSYASIDLTLLSKVTTSEKLKSFLKQLDFNIVSIVNQGLCALEVKKILRVGGIQDFSIIYGVIFYILGVPSSQKEQKRMTYYAAWSLLNSATFKENDCGDRGIKKALQDLNELSQEEPFTLIEVSVQGAYLTEIKLQNSKLDRANFSRCTLDYADFTAANLIGANLTHTNLRKAIFNNAILQSADLSSANLREADFTDATLPEVIINYETNLNDIKLENADIEGIRFIDEDEQEYCNINAIEKLIQSKPSFKLKIRKTKTYKEDLETIEKIIQHIQKLIDYIQQLNKIQKAYHFYTLAVLRVAKTSSSSKTSLYWAIVLHKWYDPKIKQLLSWCNKYLLYFVTTVFLRTRMKLIKSEINQFSLSKLSRILE